jgi:YVTN family beta-propeller protein
MGIMAKIKWIDDRGWVIVKKRITFVVLCLTLSSLIWHLSSGVSLAKHTASRVVYGPTHLYVTIKGQRDVYVIDRATLKLAKKVHVSSPPCGGFISDDGREFYMALGEDDAVAVMDTQTHEILRTVSLKSLDVPKPTRIMDPGGMDVSQDGRLLYIANESADSLSILDLSTNSVLGEIPLGYGPQAVALTPDGHKAFVTDFYSIHVVDLPTRTVKTTLRLKDSVQDESRMAVLEDGEEVFQGPRDILISPDGRWIYAAVEDTGEVVVLDTSTDRVMRKIPVGSYPGGLALSPDGARLYVARRGGETIMVMDTMRYKIIAEIQVGPEPWDIALSPDGDTAYVVNQGEPSISVIDTKSFKVKTTLVLGMIKLKNLLPRGLRRMLYVWRKERKRVKHIPFAFAIFAVLFLAPFAFTMLDSDSASAGSDKAEAKHPIMKPFHNPQLAYPDRKIAYESKRTGNWEIYIMNSDGTGQVRLTYTSAENRAPFWSSDGKHIAFVSDRDGNREVYVMNADGSDQVNLTRSRGEDFSPSWSPDGKKIAFVSMRDGKRDVYVMDAQGNDQARLTSQGDNWNPNWSPDNKKLAFVSNRDGNNEIYLMNADGAGQTNLTRHRLEDGRGSHSWSPDGSKIAWVTNRDGNWEIYVMNADGSRPVNVTRHPAEEGIGMFVWSPDGKQIAFISTRDGNEEVYAVNVDGSGSTNLSRSPGMDDIPLWSPDGRKLAFVSNRTGFDEIYVMDASGGHQMQLTFTRTKEDYPRWQP